MAEMSEHTPEQVARHTVEQNGGEYVTDVANLLLLFSRQNLTDAARSEMSAALAGQGIGTSPPLEVVHRADPIRLYLLETHRPLTYAPADGGRSGSGWGWLRPRSWKGWLAYGIAALLLIGAVAGGSEDSPSSSAPKAGAEATRSQAAARDDARSERLERVRRERAQDRIRAREAVERRRRIRAHMAAERRQRVRVRQVAERRQRIRVRRAAERRERLRQERLEAAALAAEPEPEAANCHPSYDPCLDPNASDYDCDGGSGDGPMYTGFVTVKGPDDYGLDSDGDGTGCES